MKKLGELPDVMQLSQLSAFKQRISARRLVVAAGVSGSTGDSRSDRRRARDLIDGGPDSSHTHNRDAKRAATMAASPDLGDAVGSGAIAPDSIDQLTKAADSATGEVPRVLIDSVGGLTADQTADVVERFLADQVDVDEVEERFRQQMKYRADGGRDKPIQQQKSLDHRRFDAAQALLTGTQTETSNGSRPTVVITIDGDKMWSNPDNLSWPTS